MDAHLGAGLIGLSQSGAGDLSLGHDGPHGTEGHCSQDNTYANKSDQICGGGYVYDKPCSGAGCWNATDIIEVWPYALCHKALEDRRGRDQVGRSVQLNEWTP